MRKYYKKSTQGYFFLLTNSSWFMLGYVFVMVIQSCDGVEYMNETNENEEMFKRISEKEKLEFAMRSERKRKELPEELLNEVWKLSERFEEVENVEQTQLKKFILHAKKASEIKCQNCVQFVRILPPIYQRVTKADVWIYLQYSKKRKNNRKKSSVKLYTLHKATKSKTLIARSDIKKEKDGWYKVLVNNINSWTTLHEHFLEVDALVDIVCSNCHVIVEGDSSPYVGLVAEMLFNPTPSLKRCTVNSSSCCLDDFEIKLNEYIKPITGDIIWPKVINIGMCRGSCDNVHFGYHPHSALVTAVKLQGMKETKRDGLCCVPKKYASISTIIDEGQGFLVAKSIHDLVIDECTCA